ncbi:MAG TPA: hypothetical protein VJ872_10440 [Nocardioides sp.]|nr:hypothetical protein [Nocardioides sp.]
MPAPVRRWIAAILLVAGTTLGLVAAPSGAPAGAAPRATTTSACTVHPRDKAAVQKAAAGVDAVIAARITKAVKTPGPPLNSVQHPAYWTYTIRVAATFRGSAQHGATATLVQVPLRYTPEKSLTKGATYLLFVKQQNSGFASARCGGSVLLAHGLSRSLRDKLTADLGTPGGTGASIRWTQPTAGIRDVPSLNQLIAPGVGLALIGVLGLLLIGRLAREKS